MFERTIRNIIAEAVEEASNDEDLLRRMLRAPDWNEGDLDDPDEEDEIQKLITAWATPGGIKPKVILNYPRATAQLPAFAIVLSRESQAAQVLGDELGNTLDENLIAEKEAIEAERGRPVDLLVQQFQVAYSIYVYAESPNTTLALYNFLRSTMLFKSLAVIEGCIDQPSFSGSDLMPQRDMLPSIMFTRVFTISGYGYQVSFTDLELGPLAQGRGKTVTGLHIPHQIDTTGLPGTPGIYPYEE